jgi:hypothetical protein
MFVRSRRFHLALLAFVATVGIFTARPGRSALLQQAPTSSYEDAVALPTEGTIDERPFFATRRYPAINYSDGPTTDVVAALKRKVDDGSVKIPFQGRGGYLQSVLDALHVPIESQSVVFSKTSLQSHYISPTNPRAIFYSDNVSVAFIPDAPLLEIAALDPQQGVVFYAIQQKQADRPQILRADSCLSCHESHDSLGVPGFLARSVGAGIEGETMPDFGNYISDHRSPLEQRWGGWFITGKAGTAHHMGNVTLAEDAVPGVDFGVPQPLASLDGKFNLDGYPSHFSDVAAVLVLDHQVRMINLLTRVGWETRIALDQAKKNPQDKDAADRLIASDARELADYMLFVDEAALPGKFESTSGFVAKFAADGPRDRRGRSLKQLDLVKRLLRYPCSYMIYSPAFDGLPSPAKDAVYTRLWAILSGKDKAQKYSRLSAADRAAIVGILLETKTGLPKYFTPLEK